MQAPGRGQGSADRNSLRTGWDRRNARRVAFPRRIFPRSRAETLCASKTPETGSPGCRNRFSRRGRIGMGRVQIGKAPVPFHQRDLVQRRRLAAGLSKEHPFPRTALHPQILHHRLNLQRSGAASKPVSTCVGSSPGRYSFAPPGGPSDTGPASACQGSSAPLTVQPTRQAPASGWFSQYGIDQQLIRIGGQAPVAVPMAPFEARSANPRRSGEAL